MTDAGAPDGEYQSYVAGGWDIQSMNKKVGDILVAPTFYWKITLIYTRL